MEKQDIYNNDININNHENQLIKNNTNFIPNPFYSKNEITINIK